MGCCCSVWPAAADGLEEEKTLVEGEMGERAAAAVKRGKWLRTAAFLLAGFSGVRGKRW